MTKYRVVYEFEPGRLGNTAVRKAIAECLGELHKNEIITTTDFVNQYSNRHDKTTLYRSIGVAKELGILEQIDKKPISFKEFCNLDTVKYFADQLRKNKRQNTKGRNSLNHSDTQIVYLYRLWDFNNWLHGRQFECTRTIQTGLDTYKTQKENVTLNGVEDFLKLYQQPHSVESEYVKINKQFLLDDIHKGKKAGTIEGLYYVILSYFEKNDSPIHFHFDPKNAYDSSVGKKITSLEDLMKMLTVGKPSILQKAAVLCKFHRGLDNETLCDRFNFEAWGQMVDWFGTDIYMKWDLKLCPVPIKLTRIKTNYEHIGFLERDAIDALQNWLEVRHKKTGKAIQEGEPIFINSKNNPINEWWVWETVKRLANTAGILKEIKGYKTKRYQQDSHELRDLLKSTLIDCGVRLDVAEHCIGHMPRDTYEKQAALYQESLRTEYSKASKRLNIFSNFSSMVKGGTDYQELQSQLTNLQEQLKENQKMRSNVEMILSHLKLDV